MAVKNFFKKVWSGIKKPFGFIKRKTEPAREFMRSGRKGGMILELILAALFGIVDTILVGRYLEKGRGL